MQSSPRTAAARPTGLLILVACRPLAISFCRVVEKGKKKKKKGKGLLGVGGSWHESRDAPLSIGCLETRGSRGNGRHAHDVTRRKRSWT